MIIKATSITACKECHSTELTWHTSNINRSGLQEGRLRTSEVDCLFFLGCDHCSETLATVSADRIAGLMNAQPVQPKIDSTVEMPVAMEICVREGEFFPLNRSQQVWYGDDPEVMQEALFAGQEMTAITDDSGAFKLDYLGHVVRGFSSIEDAKSAAPELARAVLARLRTLILDV
ncbi:MULTISPECIES: hypothetical protein [Pseudomonas]|nr:MULTISPECIES: hypothetical protein [Pseudomonas]